MSSWRSPRTLAGRAALLLALLPTLCAANPCAAQGLATDLWGVNGTVGAVVRVDNRLNLGGTFTTVGPCTGGGVPVDRVTGVPRAPYARVNGRVSAVVPDGSGGWFLGGHFTTVEGVPRLNLAHVLADGTLSPWNPSVVGEDGSIDIPWWEGRPAGVSALALRGRTLYLGGRFRSVGGQARNNLAAVDVTTGTTGDWNPDADNEVRCLVAQGSTIYAGGEFRNIGGLARHFIAALDAKNGQPTVWDPDAEQRVRTLAIEGRTIFAGGDFLSIGGQPRTQIAALDASTGQATAWRVELGPSRAPYPHGDWIWPFVSVVAVKGRTVYASGWFDHAGGQPRYCMAAFDRASGAVTDFDPRLSSWATVIVPWGNLLYVGGDWYDIAGMAVPHVAALDPLTGHATAWSPRANGLVEALAVTNDAVYVGGSFTSLYDWQLCNGQAALDLTTGRATARVPGDTVTATRLPAGLRLDGPLSGHVELNGAIYMVGEFIHVNGVFRPRTAAVDATSGELLPWNPLADPSGFVMDGISSIAARGHTLYLGGYFGGTPVFPRANLAAVDDAAGALLPWDPHPTGYTPWESRNRIQTMVVRGDRLWIAGSFAAMGGQPRASLAIVDAVTAAVDPFAPDFDGNVFAIVPSGDTVFVGGSFTSLDGWPRDGIAALVPPHAALRSRTAAPSAMRPAATLALSIGPCMPNPLHSRGTITFSLPRGGRANLAIFDLRGRRVATLVDRQQVTAGAHAAPLDASGWSTGVYFCRLEAAGTVATRKILVVN